jgi:GT2 family glycosyltransferase
MNRIQVHGKFFWDGEKKFFLRGATYGPFTPQPPEGSPYPEPAIARRDFSLFQAAGLNTLRVYYPPPRWFLDLAAEFDLRLLVTIPDYKRNLFLDSRQTLREIAANIGKVVAPAAEHPALLAYVVDNEMPPDLVRWYGPRKIEAHLAWMGAEVKRHDPTVLVTYANFPSTEYLQPFGLDFFTYNVFLHESADLEKYIHRLQNLCGARPLVLGEFGMDTLRHGEEAQAELLAAELPVIFRNGAAGAIIFSWTDAWYARGEEVTDWAFGLVTKTREPKPSYTAVQNFYATDERFSDAPQPPVSVVVCAYNAADTLPACLRALQKLHYPHYEIIVVDDGSHDQTPEVLALFPEIKVIRQKNLGLSAARNVGLAAATGEIIAYTDADCAPDPDWLAYAVRDLVRENWAAVGGPNFPPPPKNAVQAAVTIAPGGPNHVLFNDRHAEHIPGCNFIGRRDVFLALDGFDPQFRLAGDDVDFCWRLLEAGYRIGFSPAAVVWHDRRRTVPAYWKQQLGYGEAEALLRDKFPHYFSARGGAHWKGAVYGEISTRLEGVIYHGVFGQGFFQSIYRRPRYSWWDEVGSLEWLLVIIFTAAFIGTVPNLQWVVLAMLGAPFLRAALAASQAHFPKGSAGQSHPAAGLYLFLMELSQPWLRSWARYFPRVQSSETFKDRNLLSRRRTVEFWSETGIERDVWLSHFIKRIKRWDLRHTIDRGWSSADLFLYPSRYGTIEVKTMTEIYPQGKRLTRVNFFSRLSPTGHFCQWVFLILFFLLPTVLLKLIIFFLFLRVSRAGYLNPDVLQSAQDAAHEAGLDPLLS